MMSGILMISSPSMVIQRDPHHPSNQDDDIQSCAAGHDSEFIGEATLDSSLQLAPFHDATWTSILARRGECKIGAPLRPDFVAAFQLPMLQPQLPLLLVGCVLHRVFEDFASLANASARLRCCERSS